MLAGLPEDGLYGDHGLIGTYSPFSAASSENGVCDGMPSSVRIWDIAIDPDDGNTIDDYDCSKVSIRASNV